MKGRNSTVISIRLPDSVYTMLQERANGQSVAEYVKELVIGSVNAKDELPPLLGHGDHDSVNQPVNTTKQEKLSSLRKLVSDVVTSSEPVRSTPIPPTYNPKKHVAGDLVRKWVNGAWLELVVPELDGEGNPVPEV